MMELSTFNVSNGINFAPPTNPIPTDPPANALSIVATAFDASSKPLGYYTDNTNRTYGFITNDNNLFIPVNYPGSTMTKVTWKEAPDWLGGFYYDAKGIAHGFVEYNSTFEIEDNPNGTYGTFLTTGNATTAAGTYGNSDGKFLGYTVERNKTSISTNYITIDDPEGAKATWVISISPDSNKVAGFNIHADGTYHGFIYQDRNFTHLDVPGSLNTIAIGVNNSGQVVGEYSDSKSTWHAFLYSNGTFTTYDYPSASLTLFTDINETGGIIGLATVGANTQSFATQIVS